MSRAYGELQSLSKTLASWYCSVALMGGAEVWLTVRLSPPVSSQ